MGDPHHPRYQIYATYDCRHKYEMITDRPIFTTRWSLYGISCFHFYR